jgi:hypothetical protein
MLAITAWAAGPSEEYTRYIEGLVMRQEEHGRDVSVGVWSNAGGMLGDIS